MKLEFLSIRILSELIKKREVSPLEVTQTILDRIEDLQPKLHCFSEFSRAFILSQAKKAEKEIASGYYRGVLHGIPIAIKDIINTKDLRTSYGMSIYADYKPKKNAILVDKLVTDGAIIIGKSTTTEAASAGNNPLAPKAVNPWCTNSWTGISSSGSAVATSAGLCYGAIGTDTGGSIRTPAACNGIVGLKPTYGAVSMEGILPFSKSLDHAGPMARSVYDVATIFSSISNTKNTIELKSLSGLKIGVDHKFCTQGVDEEVIEAFYRGLKTLEQLGIKVSSIKIPDTKKLSQGWMSYAAFCAAFTHRRTYPSRSKDYGEVLRYTLDYGRQFKEEDFKELNLYSKQFSTIFNEFYDEYDVIATPTMPIVPPSAKFQFNMNLQEHPLKFYVPFNFSKHPTLCVPCGFTSKGLPLSIQFIAKHFNENKLFDIGYAYQNETPWHQIFPEL